MYSFAVAAERRQSCETRRRTEPPCVCVCVQSRRKLFQTWTPIAQTGGGAHVHDTIALHEALTRRKVLVNNETLRPQKNKLYLTHFHENMHRRFGVPYVKYSIR